MKLLCGLCFLLLGFISHGQKLLKGAVLDAQTNNPISNASVFLNTTSIGTVTNEKGDFSLLIPNGKYELIVSSIGYETKAQTINSADLTDFLTVRLKIKAEVMETVIIEPYERDGWAKWGRFFLESFIGTSSLGRDCEIKNTKVIKFRNSRKLNELSAYADEPLIIENKALGYTIRYQLETFKYDFTTKYLVYAGYPFFQPMKGGTSRQRRWENARKEAYFGSIMHFMRAVYRNKIADEGFEIHPLLKIPNVEKQRVKAIYSRNATRRLSENGGSVSVNSSKDTADYYSRVMQQSDYTDVLINTALTGDSIAYAVDSTTAGMDFENYLLVAYTKKIAPREYIQQVANANKNMVSQITLINKRPIEIQANGNYFNPIDLLGIGYWTWSEKIASLLPFDYEPPND